MPTTVELQPNFFSGGFLLFLFALVLIAPLAYKLFKKIKARRELMRQKRMARAAELNLKAVPKTMQERYTSKLKDLSKKIQKGHMEPRKGYQELSLLVRHFVKEYANVDMTTKTLAEIRSMGFPTLTALVEEYYAPEFSPDEEGDVLESINKTIKAIKSWK